MEIALKVDLPVSTVNLSSPDGPTRPKKIDTGASWENQENDNLPNSFALEAGVFHSNHLSFSWKVVEERYTVELYPLELNADRLQGSGCQLRIKVPFPLLANCLSVHENDEHFVLDMIVSTGHLYTVYIPHELLRNHYQNPELQTAITKPYSFDLVVPQFIKAINPKLLIVPLIDGHMIRLDRAEPLQQPSATTFADPLTSKSTGSGLSRIFKVTNDKVPGHPDLSSNAVVSMEVISKFLITYSVNGSVRLWSLEENTCIQLINYNGDHDSLRLRPSCYLAVRESQVVVAWPDSLKQYELGVNNRLVPSTASDASYTTIPESVRSWFVTSLNITGDYGVLMAFKKNLSCQMLIFHNGTVKKVGEEDFSQLLDLPNNNSLTNIKQRVTDSSSEILNMVLKELKHSNQDVPSLLNDEEMGSKTVMIESLEDQISRIAVESKTSVDTQWLRIDTMCRRLEALGSELLCLMPALSTGNGLFLWALRVSAVTLYCIQNKNSDEISGGDDILQMADVLVNSVPESVTTDVAQSMLKPHLFQDRMESCCAVLQNHLDYRRLNDFGREKASLVPNALRNYLENWASRPNYVTNHESDLTSLSSLGKTAVTMLVYSYALEQAKKFRYITCFAVVSVVEGWLSSEEAVELIPRIVASLRRFTFIAELGRNNLYLPDETISLANFGVTLARELIFKCDELSLLAAVIATSTSAINPDAVQNFKKASLICTPSAELTLLQSLVALSTGEQNLGVMLAQRVSLSRPWPTNQYFGGRPPTQAAWFYQLANYSMSVNANAAALIFVQYAESLSSHENADYAKILDLLFNLALQTRNVSTAYTALSRRFIKMVDIVGESKGKVEDWLNKLITAAAHNSESDARQLVISYPFIGFAQALQSLLINSVSFATVPSYKLRYAWHIEKEDFVGAAQVIYSQLRSDPSVDHAKRADLYTVCLNALSLSRGDSQWLKYRNEVVNMDDIKLQRKQLLDNLVNRI